MKKLSGVLLLVFVLTLPLLVSCQTDKPAVTGTLSSFSGPVEVLQEGKTMPAVNGMALAVNHILKTGAAAKASVEFSDGAKILLEENSELIMKELGQPTAESTVDIVVELVKGIIYFNVTKRQGSRFQMDSSVAVSGVKGTKGTFSVDPEAEIMNRWLLVTGKLEIHSKADPANIVTIEKEESASLDKSMNLTKDKVDLGKERFHGVPLFIDPTTKIDVRTGN